VEGRVDTGLKRGSYGDGTWLQQLGRQEKPDGEPVDRGGGTRSGEEPQKNVATLLGGAKLITSYQTYRGGVSPRIQHPGGRK